MTRLLQQRYSIMAQYVAKYFYDHNKVKHSQPTRFTRDTLIASLSLLHMHAEALQKLFSFCHSWREFGNTFVIVGKPPSLFFFKRNPLQWVFHLWLGHDMSLILSPECGAVELQSVHPNHTSMICLSVCRSEVDSHDHELLGRIS